MDRDVFMAPAKEVRPYFQPSRRPRGRDVMDALTSYFLKDQGSLAMTANVFGITFCTMMVYDVIARVLGPKYI